MNISLQELRKYSGIFGAICGSLLISLPAISQTAVAQRPISQVNPCPGIFYEEPHNNRVLVPEGCPPNAITQRFANQGLLPAARAARRSPYRTQTRYDGVGGEAPQVDTTRVNPCPGIYYEEPFNSRNLVPPGCPPNAFSQGQQQRDTAFVPPGYTTTDLPQTPLPSQQQPPSTTIALTNGRVNINLVNDTGARITYQVIGDTAPRSLRGNSSVMLRGITAPATLTFQREDGGLISATPQPTPRQPGMLKVTLNETTDPSQETRAMRIEQTGSVFLN